MRVRDWLRPPRHVLAIFVAVAAVSAVALGWLAWLLLEQDRSLESQRRQELLEQAADRAVATMRAALADLEAQVRSPAAHPPAGVVIVSIGPAGIIARPAGDLLYYPEPARLRDAPPSAFTESEQLEFGRKDAEAAAQHYSRLAGDRDAAIRAGALARLARVRRKLHDPDGAIRAYDELAGIPGVSVAGIPASLVAREGRASLFAETGRDSELLKEAAALQDGLSHGRWQLLKSAYQFHRSQAREWLGENAPPESDADRDGIARSEAVAWLATNGASSGPPSSRLMAFHGAAALLLWNVSGNSLTAAIGGPAWLESLCRSALPDRGLKCSLSDFEGRNLIGGPVPPRVASVRAAAATSLPWTLQVFPSSGSMPAVASPRRHLLLWIFAVLALVWCSGAWFMARAISRELRVARLQSDFVAAVSHEFRSPLSSLGQISEMLDADRFASDDLRRKSYSILVRETNRLRTLIEGLLDFGRFESGAAVYHFEPVDIGQLVQTLSADIRDRLAASGFTIEISGLPPGVYVRADRDALSRAVSNLIDNAVKYSPECRTVWVEMFRQGDRVSITVRDRGIGIPVHEQRAIFDKFVRGKDSKALRIKGTGIGLAMVRHIMRAHGGQVLLSSEPGEGSRFTLVLNASGAQT